MSTPAEGALLLGKIVAHLEQCVNLLWDYAAAHPQASLMELELKPVA